MSEDMQRDIAVFWDFENLPIKAAEVSKIAVGLRRLLEPFGRIKCLIVYKADTELPGCTNNPTFSKLKDSGFILDLPLRNGMTEVVDQAIISDAIFHHGENPNTKTFVFITEDRDFARLLSILRLRGNDVVLLSRRGKEIHRSQASPISSHFSWPEDVIRAGLLPRTTFLAAPATVASSSSSNSTISTLGAPKKATKDASVATQSRQLASTHVLAPKVTSARLSEMEVDSNEHLKNTDPAITNKSSSPVASRSKSSRHTSQPQSDSVDSDVDPPTEPRPASGNAMHKAMVKPWQSENEDDEYSSEEEGHITRAAVANREDHSSPMEFSDESNVEEPSSDEMEDAIQPAAKDEPKQFNHSSPMEISDDSSDEEGLSEEEVENAVRPKAEERPETPNCSSPMDISDESDQESSSDEEGDSPVGADVPSASMYPHPASGHGAGSLDSDSEEEESEALPAAIPCAANPPPAIPPAPLCDASCSDSEEDSHSADDDDGPTSPRMRSNMSVKNSPESDDSDDDESCPDEEDPPIRAGSLQPSHRSSESGSGSSDEDCSDEEAAPLPPTTLGPTSANDSFAMGSCSRTNQLSPMDRILESDTESDSEKSGSNQTFTQWASERRLPGVNTGALAAKLADMERDIHDICSRADHLKHDISRRRSEILEAQFVLSFGSY